MTFSVHPPGGFRALNDELFAAEAPVLSAVGWGLQKQISHLYERLTGQKLPGGAAAVVPGHTHTGRGDGAPIPRQVINAGYAVPAAGPPTPTTVNWGADVERAPALAAASPPRTLNAADLTVGATAMSWQIVAIEPCRLRAGAVGLNVTLFDSVAAGAGNAVRRGVLLAPVVRDAEVPLDLMRPLHRFSACTWAAGELTPRIRTFGRGVAESPHYGGAAATPELWINETGAPLTADADYAVVVLGACQTYGADAPAAAYRLYGLCAYETA